MTPLVDWDSPTEQWAPIPGRPGYEASTHGRVRSPRGPVLKPWISNKAGHLKVGLSRKRREWVHRAICAAFYGPCPRGLEVRHLDGDPTNNHVTNLRYGTHSENMQDRIRHGWLNIAPDSPHGFKTHCPQGHPYDDANTLRYGGRRSCRICTTERKAAYVKRQAGVRVTCDECGRAVSKLNLNTHKRTERCQGGAR